MDRFIMHIFMMSLGIVAIMTSANFVDSTPVSDTSVFSGTGMNGQELMTMGRQLNKPLLTLIGMVIQELHSCTEWTDWSSCEATRLGDFGIRTRRRSCHDNATYAANGDKQTEETDYTLCEGSESEQKFCPSDYNVTENGFCIKFYDTKTDQNAASQHCKSDGGYLVNIDSETKYADIKKFPLVSYTWIDGRRKDNGSPWEYSYGSNTGFYKWGMGDPDNGTKDLCLRIDSNKKWYDASCTHTCPFLCEIIV